MLCSHDRLLKKIAASGVEFKAVVCIREFLFGSTQSVIDGEKLSEEIRVASGVSRGCVLYPLLFLAYVNYIWKNTESTIRLCDILKIVDNMT